MIKKIFFILILISISLFLFPQESQTQKLLNLKKAQLHLQEMRGDYERALKLKEAGLISEEEFAKKETSYLRAQVEYQQALISFTGSEAKVVVDSATKWMDQRGKIHVKVSLLYSAKELEALFSLGIKEELFPQDFLKEIKDIYVSLLSDGFIISEPYQEKISSLSLGEAKEADFILLKDVESLEVSVFYAGREERTKVYLLKEASANIVTVNSSQFSQEADLGGEASFDLSLERFTREGSVFRLHLFGLPHQIAYDFIDPQTSARLSQIKFSEGITSLKLQLKLYLPKNPSEEVKIDKSIEFYTLCLDEEESNKLERSISQTAKGPEGKMAILKDIKGGKVRLEIIPRGIGRIEVGALNLYHEIKVGEDVEMDVNVKNTGTRRLDNIRIYTDLPLNWRADVEPDLIQSLEQDKERIVKIRFLPPVDVSVGDYEPKIKTECTSFGRRIESEDKIVRIHISSKTNILGITVLITLLIGLLVGIVVFGIKLTRR
ncbi:MAG: NEW3 domain-containing protein [Acidobacteriota bacterium]